MRLAIILLATSALAASRYPDAKLTPGAVDPSSTKEKVCTPGYTSTVRNVPESVKRRVLQRYGLPSREIHKVEIDHFISLELGGSNAVENLWPQYYSPRPGAREKDVVETWLHRQVCSGKISLEQAQREIRSDWYGIYEKISK